MDSKHKNILRATGRVVVAAIAAFLAWIGDIFLYLLSFPRKAEEDNYDESYEIEAGMFVHKVGPHRTIIDTLEEDK